MNWLLSIDETKSDLLEETGSDSSMDIDVVALLPVSGLVSKVLDWPGLAKRCILI